MDQNKPSKPVKKPSPAVTTTINPQTIQQTTVAFAGPIPPPNVLSEYDRIHPGLAERIVKMAEVQGEHRRELETKSLNAQIAHEQRTDDTYTRAQIFAFILSLFGMTVGAIMLFLKLTIIGTIFAGGPLVAIVIAFLKVRAHKSKKSKDSNA